MTVKEKIEVQRKNLQLILNGAIIEFQKETGLKVDELRVVTGAGFGHKQDEFLYVDVIIKL